MVKVKKYKLTISLIIILVLSVFTACSSNSETMPEIVESPGQVEESKIEITSISIKSALEPIKFGKFPQTIDEEAQVTLTPNEQGYYVGSNLQYYANVMDKYYKVEDVVWDAYKLESGDILLVSQKILFSARYDDYHDYFETESFIFHTDLFMFTKQEDKRIKKVGIKYEYRIQASISIRTKMFMLNFDQVNEIYPTKNKVLKAPTDFAKEFMTPNDDGFCPWWLAPKSGKSIYITDDGAVSNKGNTYIETGDSTARIGYALRGMVPCMIISEN